MYLCIRNRELGLEARFRKEIDSKMAEKVHFTKMHGAGNDYIYVDTTERDLPNPELCSRLWSDRHKGIGGDGLVLIGRPTEAGVDARMRIFNADGSEAMMCGNASRCIAKYLYEKGLCRKETIELQTLSGIKTLHLHLSPDGETVESVTVDMLKPVLDNGEQFTGEKPQLSDGTTVDGTFVSMGNPHYVIFVDDINNVDVARVGSQLEVSPVFPQRCNIEFAQVVGQGQLRTRVWERGSGITMACGTGACATAVAATLTRKSGMTSDVIMDGGTLHIEWYKYDGHVYMTGPAAFAFEGEVELPEPTETTQKK